MRESVDDRFLVELVMFVSEFTKMPLIFGEAGSFPTYFVLVYVVGFIAAVIIGSIAWYNSKRPAGWEEAKKPDFIPEIEDSDPEKAEEPS
jgi:hypothetical protein